MARPSKREEAKQKQGMDFLMGLLGETGQTVAEEEVKKAFEAPVQHHDYKMLQAEGVLLHLQNASKTMAHRYCKRCNEIFSTRYMSVAYCSDLCRKKAMEEIGIVWDSRHDSYQNMEAERPIVVGAKAHAVILEAAQRFLEDQNILVREDSKPQEEGQELDPQTELPPFLQEIYQAELAKQANLTFETNQPVPDTTPAELPPESTVPELDFLESPFHS